MRKQSRLDAGSRRFKALFDDEEELEESQHPRGEDFFRGHASGISDEDADRIAAEQLAASGFGPTGG